VPYIYLGRLGVGQSRIKQGNWEKKDCGIGAENGGDETMIGMRKGVRRRNEEKEEGGNEGRKKEKGQKQGTVSEDEGR
jgi:hypothetical protein